MKPVSAFLVCGIVIIFTLAAAGCVAPPQGTPSGPVDMYKPGEFGNATTPAPQSFVTEVTPFVTGTQGRQDTLSQAYATPTPIPADKSCLIYTNTQSYSYNTSAVSFDLKNPPMYISYSVIPFNITVNKVFTSRSGGGETQTLTYSDYAPYSWFEVTVRNKTSGDIYLDDGFGREKGYGIYTNATFKVLKTDDMLIEFHGNNITATSAIWVKPVGNIDNPENKTYAECKFWENQPQNSLPTATATTNPTWVPENQVIVSNL